MNGAVHRATIGSMTINAAHINASMMDDDLSDPSSPESSFDAADLLQSACQDEVTAQLAASGMNYFVTLNYIPFDTAMFGQTSLTYLFITVQNIILKTLFDWSLFNFHFCFLPIK